MYLRYADPGEGRSAHKSGSKRNLQITGTTVGLAIALSVAMANAVSYCSLLMPPRYTMDSNTDQSVGQALADC
jgi:hypothetical protein